MEYHYLFAHNSLAKILEILEKNNFFYRIIGAIDIAVEPYTLIIRAHKMCIRSGVGDKDEIACGDHETVKFM